MLASQFIYTSIIIKEAGSEIVFVVGARWLKYRRGREEGQHRRRQVSS
jgi:hypothetical protein